MARTLRYRWSVLVLIALLALAATIGGLQGIAQEPDAVVAYDGAQPWLEVDGVVYGAQPDERGPIGGGEGYAAIVTEGDYTVQTLEELIDALGQAQPGQVVFIPGETEIDLTTGVRITGLRIRGPNPKRYLDHHRRAFREGYGGHSYYYKFPTQNGISTEFDGLEVDNCEISAFGHGGVYLIGGVDHHIHHNYIHHCQYNGLGYGISHNTSSSLIECNLFDWNRHSIAGTGRPGCGYVARNNIELGTTTPSARPSRRWSFAACRRTCATCTTTGSRRTPTRAPPYAPRIAPRSTTTSTAPHPRRRSRPSPRTEAAGPDRRTG